MQQGHHQPSASALVSFFKRPSTADLVDLKWAERIFSYTVRNRISTLEIFMHNRPITTQPNFLREIINVSRALEVCITDPLTENGFWATTFKGLRQHEKQVITVNYVDIDTVNQTRWLADTVRPTCSNEEMRQYMRPGIIEPNPNNMIIAQHQGLSEVTQSYPDLVNFNGVLLSLGSQANPAHVEAFLRHYARKHCVVLCGSNQVLLASLASQDNVTALPLVNDHTIGRLNRQATIICVAGGGMTLLEIFQCHKDSQRKPTLSYIETGNGELVRPLHETENLEYFRDALRFATETVPITPLIDPANHHSNGEKKNIEMCMMTNTRS